MKPTWFLSVQAFALMMSWTWTTSAAPPSKLDLQAQCEQLKSKNFQGVLDAPTQVTSVNAVGSGDDGHCAVSGYVMPNIGFEMLLPSRWNGKFMQSGCGGHCGTTQYFRTACDVHARRGYACVVSDMGHQGTAADGLWAYDNLQAKIDWGFRATHVVALAGKALTAAFYAKAPTHSYFVGGSTGGRQALQAAQRFPWDYDGIVAISPPVDLSTIYMTFVWGSRVVRDQSGRPILGKDELELLTKSALNECDMDDGVKDAVISDPLHCAFDISELACSGPKTSTCLSPHQVDAVRKIYSGPLSAQGERLSLGGPLPGSELGQWDRDPLVGWGTSYQLIDQQPGYPQLAEEGFRFLFFWPDPGPSWKLSDFDFDRDSRRMVLRQVLYDSSNPDLRKFKAAGGKLLMLEGLNDNSVLPRMVIDYYETVERTMGGRDNTEDFLRLFVFPGVGHALFGGEGAGVVDYMEAIEKWVERDEAPHRLIAAKLKSRDDRWVKSFPLDPSTIQFTRPVYPYPLRARYQGHGDPNAAENFEPQADGELNISKTTSQTSP
ncbi:MAG: tannase/feruloyl esterase family alpha/beta hydrolase [Pseudomonadota bacterium]|nr:tannase/feruloyl esterase family alpha/beta hydrolase [Pseudomonadota bacterium]